MKHLSSSMALSLALAFAAEPLRAQGAFDFGLSLETLFDHQESLDLASMHTTVTVRDSGGGGSVTEIPGDPALLNRKFDFLSELKGEGAQGSIALPALGLVRPTFYWQALSADLRLDFLDRPEPTESTSIEGRGLLYGVGFELVTGLCSDCGWLASAGYLVHDMPSFDAHRKPRLLGDDLSNDRVRVHRRVSDASFRIKYSLPGARIIPYTGVRRRSTDLDIEDELAFRGPGPDGTSEETRLKTLTKIKGDATLAVAGLDVKFGGNLFGRMETAIGDGDRVVEVKLVYLWSKPITPGATPGTTPETTPGTTPGSTPDTAPITTIDTIPNTTEEDEKLKKRAGEIAAGTLARLIAIEKEYLAGWHALTVVAGDGGEPSYLVREVEALLKGTESALLGVTGDYPELEALGDWIKDEFERARKELGLEASGRTAGLGAAGGLPASFSGSSPRYVFASALQAPRQESGIRKKYADPILSKVRDRPVGIPREAAETGDGFHTPFGFNTEADFGNRPNVFIYPRYNPNSKNHRLVLPARKWDSVWIGSYSYEVRNGLETLYKCDANNPHLSFVDCPLNLVPKACKILNCDQNCGLEPCYAGR